MMYHEIPTPSRALHRWRYTPWHTIWQFDSEGLPEADPIQVSGEGISISTIPTPINTSNDIAKALISELATMTHIIRIDDGVECARVTVKASGHVVAGRMVVEMTHDATLLLEVQGEASWLGLSVNGQLSPQAKVYVGVMNELSRNTRFLELHDWEIDQDAELNIGTLSIGGFRCKSESVTRLIGTGAAINQAISVHGHHQRHIDHHIEIHHQVGHTRSHLNVHAACDDESHSIATGQLTITKRANQCDASQVFKNLLLSPKARAEAIPELEVLSDDVKAAHGAASAAVSQQQLHYLMSRGLTQEEAMAMIVEGFMNDVFSTISNQAVTDVLRTRLTLHLECDLLG